MSRGEVSEAVTCLRAAAEDCKNFPSLHIVLCSLAIDLTAYVRILDAIATAAETHTTTQ